MNSDPNHAWLVGASSGIGAALARELLGRGWRVTVSGRGRSKLADLAKDRSNARVVPFDVTDPATAASAFGLAEAGLGPISHLIYLAGIYQPMPLEDFDTELFRGTMETNYLGAVHVLATVLPEFCRRGRGQILLTASLAGYRGLPRAAPYNASKAALINLAESLAPELAEKGVTMRLINPGFVESRLTAKNPFKMPWLQTPEQAALRIAEGLERSGFEIAFPLPLVMILKVLRCLPYRLYFGLMRRLLR